MKLGISIFFTLLIFTYITFADTHVVKKGESLASIARKYKVSVEELIKANNIKKPYIIHPGQKLKIPKTKLANKNTKRSPSQSNLSQCKITHKVKKGDTLIKIAKKYHVWVRDIKRLNNLKSDILKVGQVLCIKQEKLKNTVKKEKYKTIVKQKIIYHKVRKGESLASIARKYGTSVRKLIQINNLKKPYIIRVGQKIKVPIKVVEKVKINDKEKIEKLYKNMPFGFIWPVDGQVISNSINLPQDISNIDIYQIGIKIKTNCNAPVKAAESGKVVFAQKTIKAYKNMVVIRHRKGYSSVYYNLSKLKAKEDSFVKKGDIIGYADKLAEPDVCGILFQIRKNLVPVNPLALLPQKKKNEVNK